MNFKILYATTTPLQEAGFPQHYNGIWTEFPALDQYVLGIRYTSPIILRARWEMATMIFKVFGYNPAQRKSHPLPGSKLIPPDF